MGEEMSNLSAKRLKVTICVLEGRDILSPFGKDCGLHLKASLGKISELYSESSPLQGNVCDFNCELHWVISKKSFKNIQSQRTRIRLEVMATDPSAPSEERPIGRLLFDTREIKPLPDEANASFSTEAVWRPLIASKSIPGRGPPSLNVSLTYQDQHDTNLLMGPPEPVKRRASSHTRVLSQETDEDRTEMDETDCALVDDVMIVEEPSRESNKNSTSHIESVHSELSDKTSVEFPVRQSMDQLKPRLSQDHAYFIIGDENSENALIWYLNIALAFVKNLHLVKKNMDEFPTKSKFNFFYFLVGIPIETAIFDSLENPNFSPEKATAKIKCTREILSRYFSQLEPLEIFLVQDLIKIGVAKFDWMTMFHVNQDLIRSGQPIVYDGVLRVDHIVQGASQSRIRSANWRQSDSDATRASIGIRITLGTSPDSGAATQFEDKGLMDRKRDVATETPLEDVVRYDRESQFMEPFSNQNQLPQDDQQRASTSGPKRPRLEESEIAENLDTKSYSLTISLKQMKMILDSASLCIVGYKYQALTDKTIYSSTVQIRNNKFSQFESDSSAYCFGFVSSEDKVKKKFSAKKLRLKVFKIVNNNRTLIATALLDLMQIFSHPLAADFSGNAIRECHIILPVVCTTKKVKIGELVVDISLVDKGRRDPISAIQESPRFESCSERTASRQTGNIQLLRLRTEAEIEEWKVKTKEAYIKQQEESIAQQLSFFAEELKKRERDRVEYEKGLDQRKDELVKSLEKLKTAWYKIETKEAEMNRKDTSLKDREERVKKMEADANEFISVKTRVKEKELEKEIENLRLDKVKLVNSQTVLRQENIRLAKRDSTQKAELEKAKETIKRQDAELQQLKEELQKATSRQRAGVEELVDAIKAGKMVFHDYPSLVVDCEEENQPTSRKGTSRSMPSAGTTDRGQRKVRSEVISDEKSTKILRLEKMRQMIIDSTVFSENDEVIKTINAQIAIESKQANRE